MCGGVQSDEEQRQEQHSQKLRLSEIEGLLTLLSAKAEVHHQCHCFTAKKTQNIVTSHETVHALGQARIAVERKRQWD